jgi:hypothetical protein
MLKLGRYHRDKAADLLCERLAFEHADDPAASYIP